jgi:hypothetical protein
MDFGSGNKEGVPLRPNPRLAGSFVNHNGDGVLQHPGESDAIFQQF